MMDLLPVNQNAAYYCDYFLLYLYNKQMFEYLNKTLIYCINGMESMYNWQ